MLPDAPAPSPNDDANLPDKVSDDVGGVQGTAPDELSQDDAGEGASAVRPKPPEDAPAPDAGEIEWAGQLVKKPPTPAA